MKGFIAWTLGFVFLYLTITAAWMSEWKVAAVMGVFAAAALFVAPSPGSAKGTGRSKASKGSKASRGRDREPAEAHWW